MPAKAPSFTHLFTQHTRTEHLTCELEPLGEAGGSAPGCMYSVLFLVKLPFRRRDSKRGKYTNKSKNNSRL